MSIRTLPKRVTPLDGEAIDSWTESLAIAHQAQLGEVAAALGLPWRPWPPWVVSLTGEQSSKISAATGLPPDRIGEMSLRKYDGRALKFADDGTSFSRGFPFGARGWSRYCPKCLDETSGRWQLQWRLGWAFACLTHNCLLVDQCPSCLNHQRERQHPRNVVPRAGICCGNFASATCGGDLRSAQVLKVDPDGPIIASQNTILKIIDTDTAGFSVYREGDVDARRALGDIVGGPLIEKRLDMLSRTPFWEGISTALIRLGDYLDTTPTVIDYGRRRSLDYSNLLPEGLWQEICDETGHRRGFGWKPLIARGFLYRMISGSPMDSAASPLPRDLEGNFWYLAKDFPHVITRPVAARLAEEARRFLDESGIAEPITWEPPLDLMNDLTLPGGDPREVDVEDLHRLTGETSSSLLKTAQFLGVSADTVRYLLSEQPAPSKDVPNARTYLRADDIARRVPLRQLQRIYGDRRNSLVMVADHFGITQKHLQRVLRFYSIPPRA